MMDLETRSVLGSFWQAITRCTIAPTCLVLQNNLVISQQEQSPSPNAAANALAIRLEKGQNDPEACIAVIQSLNSHNQETRYAIFERIAIHSKGRRASKGYQPPAVLSLRQFGELSEQLVLGVTPFLQDRSPVQRLVATNVLYDWKREAKAAASALEKAIKDPNPNVGSSALLAFASCSADEQLVTRVLLENIEDSSDLIKYEAMRGLRDFCPTTRETVPILAASSCIYSVIPIQISAAGQCKPIAIGSQQKRP
jgi:hypothetical protein